MTLAEILQDALKLEQSLHPVLVAIQGKLAAVPAPDSPAKASQLDDVAKAVLPLVLAFLPATSPVTAIVTAAPEVASALIQVEKLFAPLLTQADIAIGNAVANSRPVTPDDGTSYPLPAAPGGNV